MKPQNPIRPAHLEFLLATGFSDFEHSPNTKVALHYAKKQFAEIRLQHGFKSKGTLLSLSISKLQKNEQVTAGLSFPPHTSSGIANVCAFADSCAETCVAFSGNGGFSQTQRSRIAKLDFAIQHPAAFANLLWHELDELQRKQGRKQIAVRLNTYSDLRWERIAPQLFEDFPRINFYDYTKHTLRSRPEIWIPENYSLTYSVSEKTTPTELAQANNAGRNLAVVVEVRSGKIKDGSYRPIPRTWMGILTVDGDIRDDRHNDPENRVVILRRKHTMKPNHPMIQTAERLSR
jgi:hypothetical protein